MRAVAGRTHRHWFVGILIAVLIIIGAGGFVLFNLAHGTDPAVLPSQAAAGKSSSLKVGIATGQDMETVPLPARVIAPAATNTNGTDSRDSTNGRFPQAASPQASPAGTAPSAAVVTGALSSVVGDAISLARTLDGCVPDGSYLTCLYGVHPTGCTAMGPHDVLHILYRCQ